MFISDVVMSNPTESCRGLFSILDQDDRGHICINNNKAMHCGEGDIVMRLKKGYVRKYERVNDFTNIYLSPLAFNNMFKAWNFITPVKKEIYNVEYGSGNPTGLAHIGNMRGTLYGNSLYKMLKRISSAYSEYYVNDSGAQVQLLLQSYKGENTQYPHSVKMMLESRKHFNTEADVISFFITKIQCQMLKYKVNYDAWIYENEILSKYLKDELFWSSLKQVLKSDSRLYVQISEQDRKRYLFKEDGKATYLLGDLMYLYDKCRRGYTTLIMVIRSDHHEYIAMLKCYAHILGVNLVIKENGRVECEDGQLSKREEKITYMEDIDNGEIYMMFMEQRVSSNIVLSFRTISDAKRRYDMVKEGRENMSFENMVLLLYDFSFQFRIAISVFEVSHLYRLYCKLRRCQKLTPYGEKMENIMQILSDIFVA